MAAKNRKELKDNELAGAISEKLDRVKPHLAKILLGFAAIVVIVSGINYFLSMRVSARESKSINMILYAVENSAAGSTGRLDKQIEDHPEENSTAWAYLLKGDQELGQGMSRIFVDKEAGREGIRKSIKNFERAAKNAGDDLFLKERALFGWARAFESLGQFDEAAAKYGEVTLIENSPLSNLAIKGIGRVNNPDNRQFYALFETKDNNVFEADNPETAPATDSGLPPRPDFTYPGEETIPGLASPLIENPSGNTPSNTDPAKTESENDNAPPVPPKDITKKGNEKEETENPPQNSKKVTPKKGVENPPQPGTSNQKNPADPLKPGNAKSPKSPGKPPK